MQGEVFAAADCSRDVPGAIYFVTGCLEGSIPAQGMLDISTFRRELEERPVPEGMTRENWKERQGKLVFARADSWLNQALGIRHLESPDLAMQVVEAMNHFAGHRYDLFAFVVMPSHFHWVFQPQDDWIESLKRAGPKRTPRERIMHTVKLHTAIECNRLLGRAGTFWQEESYDHCVLDIEELGRIIEYVENNPVKAGLCATPEEWPYSSVAERRRLKLPYERPLPRGAGCQPAV